MKEKTNLLMLVVFLGSAAVQYNDPDPFLWGAIYVLAAGTCWLWHRGQLLRMVSGFLCFAACAAAIGVGLSVPDDAQILVAIGDWHMSEHGSELVRESGGLALVGLWMATLFRWSE